MTNLADTGSTCIGEYKGAYVFQVGNDIVSFHSGPNLLRAWGTKERNLQIVHNMSD